MKKIVLMFIFAFNPFFSMADDDHYVLKVGDSEILLPYNELSKVDEDRVFSGEHLTVGHETALEYRVASMPSMSGLVSMRKFMSPVKDQGSRGTCGTFAAIALMESYRLMPFSEQCLAKLSSDKDRAHILDRIIWAENNKLYLQSDCHYDNLPTGRDNIPLDLAHKPKFEPMGRKHVKNQNDRDAIDFIKSKISAGIPVGVSVLVLGPQWDQREWVPAEEYKVYENLFPFGPRETVVWTVKPFMSLFDLTTAWSKDFHQKLALHEFYMENASILNRFAFAGYTKSDENFEKYFHKLMPIYGNVSQEVISRTCTRSNAETDENDWKTKCPSHAVVITGFDDSTQTFQFKNSWSRWWKHDGYGYMSYHYFSRFHTSDDMVAYENPKVSGL